MPAKRYSDEEILDRTFKRYFRDFGPMAIQPSSASTASHVRKTDSWRVCLQNMHGTLAIYRVRVSADGRLKFEQLD